MAEHIYTPHPAELAALLRGATQIRVVLDPQPVAGSILSRVFERREGQLYGGFKIASRAQEQPIPLPYAIGDGLHVLEQRDDGAEMVTGIRGRLHSNMLRVTDVKVERVQDISAVQAVMSGIDPIPQLPPQSREAQVLAEFRDHWNATHGPDAWDRNDWVAVYELEKLT